MLIKSAGEGLVALTEEEVKMIHLPKSNRAKKEPSKHIYLVAVFHQLHCLVSSLNNGFNSKMLIHTHRVCCVLRLFDFGKTRLITSRIKDIIIQCIALISCVKRCCVQQTRI